jgi:CBS domain containing-hemolysin-like protein
MISTLLLVAFFTTLVSACCSMTEAALFAVPYAYIKHLAEAGNRRAKMLLPFKEDLSKPIVAILTLNTVANTLGPAIAGAIVADLWGEGALIAFSIIFTLVILYLGEMIPKTIGSAYCKTVSLTVALPLSIVIKLLYPLVRASEFITQSFKADDNTPTVSSEEVASLAAIGREEGVIDHLEGSIIKNVIGLDKRLVKDILTPRVVVLRLPEELTLTEVKTGMLEWNHTRVPIFSEDEPDVVTRYVIQRDLYRAIFRGEEDKKLKDFARPMATIPEFMRVDKLLLRMFEEGEFIYSVVDEHGGFAGLVTLEDVLEEVIGREIVDEYDLVGDLRSYAQILHLARKKRLSS